MKKRFFKVVTIILAFIFIFIIGEILTRGYYFLKYTKLGSNGPCIILDKELGFSPAPNYVLDGKKSDIIGKSYSVKCTTDSNGFRIFGNPQETIKKKVLFLGDSFTYAEEVSDEKTYFGILKKDLSIETFAFGCKGYGTLQEYIILDKWLDKIRPDIIVIQFCSNDFINNHYELELRSKCHNNGMRRPYLTKNGIIYKNPNNFSVIRDFANKYSRFLYVIISLIDRLNVTVDTSTVENIIEDQGLLYPYYKESVEITERLIKKIKLRTPSTTLIYAFSADYSMPYHKEFKRISKENGIYFIDGIPQLMEYSEKNGVPTRTEDGVHWNETGHQIVAYALQEYFKSHW
ncbi:MAG: SGNH/GDSL hydrolase family protein [Deltaproteobacteria bacterium]|nr:SGNH/GDSL hydrolase family protein [Deltaproteobacteria bacterium]